MIEKLRIDFLLCRKKKFMVWLGDLRVRGLKGKDLE